MIIGLTGANGSGKTAAADHLRKKGFEFHSLSDEIREELARLQLEPNRENLIEQGNRLRAEFGPAVLAERIKRKLRPDRHYVIDSVRSPYEVDSLRETGAFRLLHIDAPRALRFERVCARGGERAPASLEEFVEQEEREMEGGGAAHQQLRATWRKADAAVENAGAVEQLTSAIDKTAAGWLMEAQRPDWDEYFMQIARIAALRSNCMKRKVAAVIVKDRRIISTGYNGTPRGVKNCNEGGCPRCNGFADSGSALGDCFCSHAEENAIVQAAYHGIGVSKATLYTTYSPCLICTKMIINAGINEVVYNLDYPLGEVARDLLAEAGVAMRQIHLN